MLISEVIEKLKTILEENEDMEVEDDDGLDITFSIYEDDGEPPVLVIS